MFDFASSHPLVCLVTAGVALITGGAGPNAAPLFPPNQVIAVGSTPGAVESGDFNGDGAIDFAVANTMSDAVSVILGRGDGTFDPETRYAVGRSPKDVVIDDFDQNGAQDLATANSVSGDVSLLLGNGDGSFGAETRIAVGFGSRSIAVGDFDDDGRRDIAVAAFSSIGDIFILPGRGDGTFAPPVPVGAGAYVVEVAIGDLDGDDRQDLALTKNTDEWGIALGHGDGTFGPPHLLPIGEQPGPIGVGDLDLDGHQDLAIGVQGDGAISVFLGNGDGTFAPASSFGSFGSFEGPYGIVVGDVDEDGLPDLVGTDAGTHEVRVLLGNGDGTFGPDVPSAVVTNGLPKAISLGDFDGDGRSDIVSANENTNNLATLLGDGEGSFGLPKYPVGLLPLSVATGDFDANGDPDVVATNLSPDEVSILLGLGDGSLAPEVRFPAGGFPAAVAVGDLNGDERTDLAVANFEDVSILLGAGDGTFHPQSRYAAGISPSSIGLADFDGDGALDLAVGNADSDDVSILLGTGDGAFLEAVHFPAGDQPGHLIVNDLDSNGTADVVVVSTLTNEVAVLLGTGDGGLAREVRFPAGETPAFIAAGDFDGSGSIDLAVANRGSSDVSLLFGNGDGTFLVDRTIPTGAYPESVVARDLNGDGDLDLAVANGRSDDVSVLVGRGDGSFEPQVLFGSANRPRAIVSEDLDGDGRQDLVLAGASGGSANQGAVIVMLNRGEVPNQVPTAALGPGRRFECTSPLGATVTLDGSGSSDADSSPGTNDDIVLFEWFEDFGAVAERSLGEGELLDVMLALGEHTITLRVTDSRGATDTDQATFTVTDETAPSLSVAAHPDSLWPPNHRMVDVGVTIVARDECGPVVTSLSAATSNEPDDAPGSGDGNTTDDIQDAELGSPDEALRLRAERAGSGAGRTYTLTYMAVDASGNTVEATELVVVDHDRAGRVDPLELRLARGAGGVWVSWEPVSEAVSYDVVRGDVSQLVASEVAIDLGAVICLYNNTQAVTVEDWAEPAVPPPGSAFFYLVGYSGGSMSGYGTESAGKPRVPAPASCQ